MKTTRRILRIKFARDEQHMYVRSNITKVSEDCENKQYFLPTKNHIVLFFIAFLKETLTLQVYIRQNMSRLDLACKQQIKIKQYIIQNIIIYVLYFLHQFYGYSAPYLTFQYQQYQCQVEVDLQRVITNNIYNYNRYYNIGLILRQYFDGKICLDDQFSHLDSKLIFIYPVNIYVYNYYCILIICIFCTNFVPYFWIWVIFKKLLVLLSAFILQFFNGCFESSQLLIFIFCEG
eukprot:TRINITY_DN2582_c0_g1_i12.p3 TRINITY_DN2582_c0_g1~~TRINITY_DN2582_c0_g1_i12.p3  ORF type:complete len:233 (-),score=-13.00 TRINITY_DN2582_c0_g1_i12:918-1616(-)